MRTMPWGRKVRLFADVISTALEKEEMMVHLASE
jgi:hypothetical protein